MKRKLLIDLLNRALKEELGTVVTTNNPRHLAAKLHEITKDNPAYADLELTVPSTPDTVIIVKKSVELDEPAYAEGDLPNE